MAIVTLPWRRWLTFGLWNPDKGKQYAEPPYQNSPTGENVTDQRALAISATFRAIRLISEASSMLPLNVYRKTGPNSRELAPDFWLSILLRQPNPFMTGLQFRKAMAAGLAGWGNHYSEIARNSAGRPVYLWPLKNEGMDLERLGAGGMGGLQYTYKGSGETSDKSLAADRVLHTKMFTMDGITGVSPLGLARQTLALSIAAEEYAGAFYANGGRPTGVLMVDKPMTAEQRNQAHQKYGVLTEGQAKFNGLMVLDAFAKYQPVGISPEDAQMLATRQFQIGEIARFFSIPPFLLFDSQGVSGWPSSGEQQNLAFLTYTLLPYLEEIEETLSAALLTPAERRDYVIEHDTRRLQRADATARANYLKAALGGTQAPGWMTANEARLEEGQDVSSDPNANRLYGPMDQQAGSKPPVAN